jgi:sulfopyruvate decarboxylase subunit alpha
MAEDDPDMTLVRLAKEEEGVGISAGAHLAGVKSAMLMQNHGFLASINGIVSCAQLYRIPLLMLISYRGEFGERDPWQTEGGGVTEDLLRALRIPFVHLDNPEHVARRIRKAQTLAESANKPVALLLCRDLMWEEDAATASERSERASVAERAAKRRASGAVEESEGQRRSDEK